MRRRGMTLVELMTSLALLLMGLVGYQMLFAAGLRSTLKTNASTVVAQENAQGIRHVAASLNEALSATITDGGKRISYVLPKKATTPDPVTGQIEYLVPIEPDGVSRYYQVTGGNLVDQTGRVLVRDIVSTDLDPNSSQFNQTYSPFQFTTIGGTRAVTINFVTALTVGDRRYAKMKSTVLLRNCQ